jgi:methyl-accepting chemotaxis protein
MDILVQPAVGLMHRLGLRTKFQLVGSLFLLPSVILFLSTRQLGRIPAEWLEVAALLVAAVAFYLLTALYLASLRTANDLLAAVKQLAEGDLTVRVVIEGRDEVCKSAMRVNEMVRETGRLIADVSGAAEEVASASSELAASAASVLTGASEQHKLAEAASSAVEQMRHGIEQVSAGARETEGIARSSEQLAGEGATVVRQACTEMELIRDSVTDLSALVSSLGTRSGEISSIIEVIKEIADQTNLLALNAAIEAARAGEHGRGFAVVSDEVRKLAERTANATGEISGMISAILREIEAAVVSMDKSKSQAEKGVLLAQKAGSALLDIQQGAHDTLEHVHAIAIATSEQHAASNYVAESMAAITAKAKSNETVSKEAASVAGYLESLAKLLRSGVAHFKL